MKASEGRSKTGRLARAMRRTLAGAAALAALAALGPGSARASDARTGDAEAIGGHNIAELREEIIDERLSCSGGAASPWWAVGLLAAGGAWRARRTARSVPREATPRPVESARS